MQLTTSIIEINWWKTILRVKTVYNQRRGSGGRFEFHICMNQVYTQKEYYECSTHNSLESKRSPCHALPYPNLPLSSPEQSSASTPPVSSPISSSSLSLTPSPPLPLSAVSHSGTPTLISLLSSWARCDLLPEVPASSVSGSFLRRG